MNIIIKVQVLQINSTTNGLTWKYMLFKAERKFAWIYFPLLLSISSETHSVSIIFFPAKYLHFWKDFRRLYNDVLLSTFKICNAQINTFSHLLLRYSWDTAEILLRLLWDIPEMQVHITSLSSSYRSSSRVLHSCYLASHVSL